MFIVAASSLNIYFLNIDCRHLWNIPGLLRKLSAASIILFHKWFVLFIPAEYTTFFIIPPPILKNQRDWNRDFVLAMPIHLFLNFLFKKSLAIWKQQRTNRKTAYDLLLRYDKVLITPSACCACLGYLHD